MKCQAYCTALYIAFQKFAFFIFDLMPCFTDFKFARMFPAKFWLHQNFATLCENTVEDQASHSTGLLPAYFEKFASSCCPEWPEFARKTPKFNFLDMRIFRCSTVGMGWSKVYAPMMGTGASNDFAHERDVQRLYTQPTARRTSGKLGIVLL